MSPEVKWISCSMFVRCSLLPYLSILLWQTPKSDYSYLIDTYTKKKRGIYTCPSVTLAVGSHPNRTNRIDTHAGVYTKCTQKCASKSMISPRHTPAAYIHTRRRHLCICLWLGFEFPTFKSPKTKRTVSLFQYVVLRPPAQYTSVYIPAATGRCRCKITKSFGN